MILDRTVTQVPRGSGKIVFSGDANLWEKVPEPLLRNTLRWFATY